MDLPQDIQTAKARLTAGGYTLVLCRGTAIDESRECGVRPLLARLEKPGAYAGFSAADRVVGRAAAFLYAALGVTAVYAGVISRPAIDTLRQYGITPFWDQAVGSIRNREQTGPCPMEAAVAAADSPQQAIAAIRAKAAELAATRASARQS